ncbi:uncharacterized protein isoform X1 [Leptinotarsa decemlineata]|uniref:uncharacterized protein isoform X1 n=1 Tax=Leptinotarsa decemlineata TaxID=7539 RepID=UPI003D30949B
MATVRTSPIMLVSFADASMDGYGAVAYVRTVTEKREIAVNLLCAKSKVSPFKIVTIPRLELVAALLLSRFVKHVLKIFNNKICISKIFAFSDSTTVLQWMNSTLLKDIFVANRVAQIKDNISKAEWCHISGLTNPADILFRGATPSQLMENYLWISGPTWMKLPVEDWPISEKSCFENCGQDIDSIKCIVSMEDTKTHPLYEMVMRSSSYIIILRITVRVLRFVKLLPVKEIITASDMYKAELVLVRIVQAKYFASDIKLLNLRKEISNRLRKLNPFLQNGVLMVGIRLENAPISFAARHPIILPSKDPSTEKLIDYYHKIYLHTGPYLMEAILRQIFWILEVETSFDNEFMHVIGVSD